MTVSKLTSETTIIREFLETSKTLMFNKNTLFNYFECAGKEEAKFYSLEDITKMLERVKTMRVYMKNSFKGTQSVVTEEEYYRFKDTLNDIIYYIKTTKKYLDVCTPIVDKKVENLKKYLVKNELGNIMTITMENINNARFDINVLYGNINKVLKSWDTVYELRGETLIEEPKIPKRGRPAKLNFGKNIRPSNKTRAVVR